MTELETHLLSALRSLHEEFKIQHDEYMKSANELRQIGLPQDQRTPS